MRGRSGFALIVGLFSVMLLFFLATVVLDTTRQNFAFSRHSAERVQAQFAAQAGTQWALRKLNLPGGNNWETAMLSGAPQTLAGPAGTSCNVSLESLDATRINIIASGYSAAAQERLVTLVKRKPAVDALQFAVTEGLSDPLQADRIWVHSQNSPNWQPMVAPWQFESAPGTLPWADATDLRNPSGDAQGNLACVARKPGRDFVMYYSAGDTSWRQLPAPPVPGAAIITGLSTLATGEILVLVRCPATADQICLLSSPTAAAWQTLPQPPDPVCLPTLATAPVPTTWEWEAVASESRHIFALQRWSSGIFRFTPASTADWSSGNWEELPLPRKVTYTIASRGGLQSTRARGNPGTPRSPGTEGAYPGKLNYMACDPNSGQLFARAPGQGIDTIYHFTPDNGSDAHGSWTPDPLPPPGWTWTKGVGWEHLGTFVDLIFNSVDQGSNLCGVYSLAGQADVPYMCDLSQKRWRPMSPVSAGPGTRPLESGSPSVDICGFGGGGIAESGRTVRYTPLYSHP